MNENESPWTHLEQGYACALPLGTYRTGFIIMAKLGELAERIEYYPIVTLEQSRITIVVPTDDEAKAKQLQAVIDDMLPPIPEVKSEDETAESRKGASKSRNKSEKKSVRTPRKKSAK